MVLVRRSLRVSLAVAGFAAAVYAAASLTGGWLGTPPWWAIQSGFHGSIMRDGEELKRLGDWKYHPDQASEIEVVFTPEGDRTRVTLEHRHIERFGATAEALHEGVSRGWSGVLELYSAGLASSESAAELMQ